ncbi:MAG TPA: alpha-2-macroglobulin family protein, partial [Candidatus Obscuribacterales bacterium]
LEPGAEQTLQLELKDAQGQPTRGQLTVMVVNEAVLQLSGYRPPDLVKTVYAEQPISIRFADNRPDVVLEPQSSPLQKGWGYGGGRSAGAANTRTRTNFQALAYYNGSVLADANGRAQVSFKLPDDLTTWRILAVATDGNLRFGQADSTFLTTKPLLANPVLPQFARPGDRLEAGLAVTNNTGQAGNLAIAGTLQGNLQFTSGNRGTQAQNLQAQLGTGTQAYRFPITATNSGTTQVRFTAALNGNADSFEVPLEVKPLEITEQVVETGATNDKQVKIPLNVDRKVVPGTGGLEVSLASTLIPAITAPAQQVLEEEQLPFLEPAASQLAIAASIQTLSQKYNQPVANFDLPRQANQALAQI